MKSLIFALFVASVPALDISLHSITINGVVVDISSGQPLAGVKVQETGSRNAEFTGSDGSFSINVRETATTLTCSLRGYETQKVPLNNNVSPLTIKLKRSDPVKKEEAKAIELSSEANAKVQYDVSQPTPGNVSGLGTTHSNGLRRQTNGYPNNQSYSSNHFNTEDYDDIMENRFLEASANPLSTFSIDVDGASYSNVRRFLNMGQLPPAGAVRIEELINYFHYNYPQPRNGDPFTINTEINSCPWNDQHKLVMIGLQGKKIPVNNLPSANLVFLIDVSGSMMDENKLPLVKSSLKLLVEQLREEDRVAIVVYAGNAGLVLPSTSGEHKQKIIDAIESLEAGGSTAGGAGIKLAYKVAEDNFMREGNNRVILCTDGDFNVGLSSDAALVELIEEERKSGVFLTVLGYGMGNYKDNKMQKLADKGNGNHSYIDNLSEAKKVLVNEFGGTLFTIAKDVKIQVEFNPSHVQAYRLVGYENRLLNKEDFNNDKKDAGDIGSGHTVTALYEIVPVGVNSKFIEKVDDLKYQKWGGPHTQRDDGELMTIKFRYKKPDGDKSKLIEHPIMDKNNSGKTSDNFRFVAAVAQFGMLLTDSEFKQDASFDSARKLASGALGDDEEGYRSEFLELINNASKVKGESK
jgi:Ca-activated chloride channel homolog